MVRQITPLPSAGRNEMKASQDHLKKIHLGFTLVEAVVTLAIMAIVAAIAYPNLMNWIETKRISSAAEAIKGELMFAKSLARQQSKDIYFVVSGEGSAWSVALSEEASCDITGVDATKICGVKYNNVGPSVQRTLRSTDFGNISIEKLDFPSGGSEVKYGYRKDKFEIDTGEVIYIILDSPNGSPLSVVIEENGYVRICVEDGEKPVGGYPKCT